MQPFDFFFRFVPSQWLLSSLYGKNVDLKDLVSVLPVSRYQLRRNNNGILLERPQLRTKKTLGDRALSMAAPFLWNSLPLPIRQETSIDSFKRSVKTYLFKKAFS